MSIVKVQIVTAWGYQHGCLFEKFSRKQFGNNETWKKAERMVQRDWHRLLWSWCSLQSSNALLNDETCTDNLPHQTVIPDQPAYSKLHKFVKTNKRDSTSVLNLCDVLIAFKSKVDLSNKRENEYL